MLSCNHIKNPAIPTLYMKPRKPAASARIPVAGAIRPAAALAAAEAEAEAEAELLASDEDALAAAVAAEVAMVEARVEEEVGRS